VGVELVAAGLGLIFAGLVKGAVGFGLPMIATPLLTHFVGARTAVVAMSFVNLISMLMVVGRGRGVPLGAYFNLLVPLTAAAVVGIILGARLLTVLNQAVLNGLVGSTAVLFALLSAARLQPRLPAERRTLVGVLVGFGAGLLGGTTSVFATPIVIYFQTLDLPKREFLVLLNLVLAISTTVQIVSYAALGLYNLEVLQTTALAAACAGLGVFLGLRIQQRVNQRVFNLAVTGVIFVVGLGLVVRALSAPTV
jgi:uncharacterized membrane protein YfcA